MADVQSPVENVEMLEQPGVTKNAMAGVQLIVEDVELQGQQEQVEIEAEIQVEKEVPVGIETERDTGRLRHIMKEETPGSVMEIAQYPVLDVEMRG